MTWGLGNIVGSVVGWSLREGGLARGASRDGGRPLELAGKLLGMCRRGRWSLRESVLESVARRCEVTRAYGKAVWRGLGGSRGVSWGWCEAIGVCGKAVWRASRGASRERYEVVGICEKLFEMSRDVSWRSPEFVESLLKNYRAMV